MTTLVRRLTLAAILALVAIQPAAADTKPQPGAAAAAATLKDVEKTFGFVPAFMRSIPQLMLPTWWESLKAFDMNPTTALDGKTKELIGLAVAASIPCEYCVIFHTEAARLDGASEQEIQEAVGVAAHTRSNSTLMNGLQVDKAQFRRDIDRLVKGARQAKK